MTDNNSLLGPGNPTKFNQGKLLKKQFYFSSIVKIRISDTHTSGTCLPGQFINIKVSDNFTPLLRRPFSVHRIANEQQWFEILFQIIGNGTQLLSEMRIGDNIDFLGPLGNRFVIPEKIDVAVLIAGGLGIAPLFLLCQELVKKNIPTVLFWGNRNRDSFAVLQDFEELGINIYKATDDGSLGLKGTVTNLFQNELKNFEDKKCEVYACGPNPMLESLQKIVKQKNINCQMSLETIMGCGFGVCMGCNIVSPPMSNKYKYVCKDGPVFNSGEIEISG